MNRFEMALELVKWARKRFEEHIVFWEEAKSAHAATPALIIAHKAEKDAKYALSTLPNVSMMTYEVEFRLKEMEPLP